ncbi:MAG: hypothetical protein Q9168_006859, partial [Polycauliona sp. 1 TL-2023]
MLRRKRGADFDLSDSDDDVEARRRRKRKEFAKMRKALLENENLGKIAEDPKKIAFLRAIEDREDDEDLDFLEQPEEFSQPAMDIDSQPKDDSQAANETEDAQTAAIGKCKRPLKDSNPETTNRLPPAARRTTTTMRKPLSLAEIRASVSFLIEEPDAMNIPLPSSSPVPSDNENDENEDRATMDPPPAVDDNADNDNTNGNDKNPFTTRRRPNPVIDRLSLKRNASTSNTSSSSHLAFQNPTTSTSTTFKIPSLLRRATTSSFNTNSNTTNLNNSNFHPHSNVDSNGISTLAETERSAGGKEKEEFVRRGGTKRSSVNFVKRRVVRGVERG